MFPTKVVRSASGLWHSIVAVRSLIFCDRRKRVSSVANLGGIHCNIHSSDLKTYCEKIPVLEVCLPVKVCRHNTSPSVFVWGCQQHHITGEFVAVLNTKDIANADLKISHLFFWSAETKTGAENIMFTSWDWISLTTLLCTTVTSFRFIILSACNSPTKFVYFGFCNWKPNVRVELPGVFCSPRNIVWT